MENHINEGEQINYKIVISDFNNNTRTITIPIVGKKKKLLILKRKLNRHIMYMHIKN